MGAKKRPFYRVVVADARSPRDGRFIETIGHYNPLTEPATIVLNEEKVRTWISHGAQPTLAVTKLMKRAGISTATQPAAEPAQVDEMDAAPLAVDSVPAVTDAASAPAETYVVIRPQASTEPSGSEPQG